uniref:Uncharacterized protein n=1 Tax=Leersia perrieri TaxID=77586 RepID=A0A0D9XES7_9ORYZ
MPCVEAGQPCRAQDWQKEGLPSVTPGHGWRRRYEGLAPYGAMAYGRLLKDKRKEELGLARNLSRLTLLLLVRF